MEDNTDKHDLFGELTQEELNKPSSKQYAGRDKNIKVSITPVNDMPGVLGYHITRTEEDDEEECHVSEADIYNLDCLEFMAKIPDESVDLIIADPPYFETWGDFDFIWDSEDEYLEWIYQCLREFYRILNPTGTLVLWGTLKTDHDALAEIIVWNKRNKLFRKKGCVTQRNSRGTGMQDNYMSTSEQFLFYTKSDIYTFNVPYLDEPTGRKDKGANGKERPHGNKRVSDVWIDIAEASQSSIQRCFHPTTKAFGLCDRIVKTHSNEGDLVYVPFAGSGSEIISCVKNNRRSIGTEISEGYFIKSITRIKDRLSD